MTLNKNGMVGLICLLFAVLIVGVIYFYVLKPESPKIKPSDKKFYHDAGVDTSSYKGIIDSTKSILRDANMVGPDSVKY